MSPPRESRRPTHHVLCVLCLTVPLSLFLATSGAARAEPVPVTHKAPEDANSDVPPERRVQIAAGLLFLWILIGVIGVGLLILVIVWGRQVRRNTGMPAPRTALRDELWYLKSDKRARSAKPPDGVQDEDES